MAWTNTPNVPYTQRQRIKNRDNHTCQRCGAQNIPLEVNHIHALADGGTNHDDNLETLCRPCHAPQTKAQTLAGHRRRTTAAQHPGEQHPGLT